MLSDDERLVNVRSGPGLSNALIDRLQINEEFRVLEGPRCDGGYAWYFIAYGGGVLEGWIAEGDSSGYFVGPRDLPEERSSGVGRPTAPAPGLRTVCDVLIEDDFEGSTANDWFVGTAARSVVRVRDGAYQVGLAERTGSDEAVSWGSLRGIEFEDATVEAVIRASSFSGATPVRVGLWVRYQGEDAFIAFMLRGDGAYRIARWQDRTYTDLIPWTRTGVIRTGDQAPNSISINMIEDTFEFYINGEFVVSVQDSTYEGGRVAFWGASETTPMLFSMDYFRVCRN